MALTPDTTRSMTGWKCSTSECTIDHTYSASSNGGQVDQSEQVAELESQLNELMAQLTKLKQAQKESATSKSSKPKSAYSACVPKCLSDGAQKELLEILETLNAKVVKDCEAQTGAGLADPIFRVLENNRLVTNSVNDIVSRLGSTQLFLELARKDPSLKRHTPPGRSRCESDKDNSCFYELYHAVRSGSLERVDNVLQTIDISPNEIHEYGGFIRYEKPSAMQIAKSSENFDMVTLLKSYGGH